MLVNMSTTSPRRRLSSSGRAKFLGRTPFKLSFSRSIACNAASITLPISGLCAAALILLHLASAGTKKIFSAVYSSLSSGSASSSPCSSKNFCSKRSLMYFRKMSPSTTPLYCEASILPRRTLAAFQISSSKPMLIVSCFLAIICLFFYEHKLPVLVLQNEGPVVVRNGEYLIIYLYFVLLY